MSALLAAVGIFSGALVLLPKAGKWMVWVKRTAGVIMLAMAEYYFIQMGMVF
jgi:thiol:disulfide interchange protein